MPAIISSTSSTINPSRPGAYAPYRTDSIVCTAGHARKLIRKAKYLAVGFGKTVVRVTQDAMLRTIPKRGRVRVSWLPADSQVSGNSLTLDEILDG